MAPRGELDLDQYWLRQWLVAWQDETITRTNADSKLLASIPVQFYMECTKYGGKIVM